MKSLEKATADYEKAKEKMEASKARYEADLKRFKAAEIAKTEAENLEIVKIIRAMDMSIPFFPWLSHNLPLLFQDFSSLLLSGRLLHRPFPYHRPNP